MDSDEKKMEKALKDKGAIAKVKSFIEDKAMDLNDHITMQLRAKYFDRWAKLSDCPILENGQYDYSQIDYENKWVKLEWWMTDYSIFLNLGDPKTRAQALLKLPEDCRETYFEVGPGNDRPYSEIYFGTAQITHGLKDARKRAKAEKKKNKNKNKSK